MQARLREIAVCARTSPQIARCKCLSPHQACECASGVHAAPSSTPVMFNTAALAAQGPPRSPPSWLVAALPLPAATCARFPLRIPASAAPGPPRSLLRSSLPLPPASTTSAAGCTVRPLPSAHTSTGCFIIFAIQPPPPPPPRLPAPPLLQQHHNATRLLLPSSRGVRRRRSTVCASSATTHSRGPIRIWRSLATRSTLPASLAWRVWRRSLHAGSRCTLDRHRGCQCGCPVAPDAVCDWPA
jgi:hypothetical protein